MNWIYFITIVNFMKITLTFSALDFESFYSAKSVPDGHYTEGEDLSFFQPNFHLIT